MSDSRNPIDENILTSFPSRTQAKTPSLERDSEWRNIYNITQEQKNH